MILSTSSETIQVTFVILLIYLGKFFVIDFSYIQIVINKNVKDLYYLQSLLNIVNKTDIESYLKNYFINIKLLKSLSHECEDDCECDFIIEKNNESVLENIDLLSLEEKIKLASHIIRNQDGYGIISVVEMPTENSRVFWATI